MHLLNKEKKNNKRANKREKIYVTLGILCDVVIVSYNVEISICKVL